MKRRKQLQHQGRVLLFAASMTQFGLNELHDVSVTRLSRGDVEFMALPDTKIQLGDQLQVVGEPAAIANAAKAWAIP